MSNFWRCDEHDETFEPGEKCRYCIPETAIQRPSDFLNYAPEQLDGFPLGKFIAAIAEYRQTGDLSQALLLTKEWKEGFKKAVEASPLAQLQAIERAAKKFIASESTKHREPNFVSQRQESEAVIERFIDWLDANPAPLQPEAIEKAVDEECARWQDAIHDRLCKLSGLKQIDGSGCDSGDPLDYTIAVINKAVLAIEDSLEPREARPTRMMVFTNADGCDEDEMNLRIRTEGDDVVIRVSNSMAREIAYRINAFEPAPPATRGNVEMGSEG